MYNINPSLVHGLALQWAERKYPDEIANRYQRERVDVRVYDTTGSGYYFIHGVGPGKWYRRDNASDDHYTNCQITQVQSAIDAGGRVQIIGDRGKSLGVWPDWESFAADVLGEKSGNR